MDALERCSEEDDAVASVQPSREIDPSCYDPRNDARVRKWRNASNAHVYLK